MLSTETNFLKSGTPKLLLRFIGTFLLSTRLAINTVVSLPANGKKDNCGQNMQPEEKLGAR
jgi:hypothetical protein